MLGMVDIDFLSPLNNIHLKSCWDVAVIYMSALRAHHCDDHHNLGRSRSSSVYCLGLRGYNSLIKVHCYDNILSFGSTTQANGHVDTDDR
jgi:hypothetical protein